MRILTIITLCIGCIGLVHGCSKVYEEVTKCRSESLSMSIVCPAKHIIRIKDAKYMRSSGSSCVPKDLLRNTCVVSPDIVTGVKSACDKKLSCVYNMPNPAPPAPASCNGFTGEDYVWVMYTCEPEFNKDGNARAISLCTKETWSGTFTYLDNEPLAALFNKYTKQTDCMCALTIPANEEIALQSVHFKKSATPRFKCDQRVVIWDDIGHAHTICEKETMPTLLGCDKERRLMMRYESDDTNIGALFMIGIKVHHDSRFTVECGLKYPDDVTAAPVTTETVTTTTTATTTTTTPTTTQTPTPTPTPTSTTTSTTTATPKPTTTTTTAPANGETTAASARGGTTAAAGPVVGQSTLNPSDTSKGGPAQETDNSSLIVGLIVGAVVLACLIMFIIILVMYCSHRSRTDDHKPFHDSSSQVSNDSSQYNYTDYNRHIQYMKDPNNDIPYAYVTEVYVDGDTPSKLVLDKEKPFYVHT